MHDSFLQQQLIEALDYTTDFSRLDRLVRFSGFAHLINKNDYYDKAFDTILKTYVSDDEFDNHVYVKNDFLQMVLNLDKISNSKTYYTLSVNQFFELNPSQKNLDFLTTFLSHESVQAKKNQAKKNQAKEIFPLEYAVYENIAKQKKLNLKNVTALIDLCRINNNIKKINNVLYHIELYAYKSLDVDIINYLKNSNADSSLLVNNGHQLHNFFNKLYAPNKLSETKITQFVKFFIKERDLDIGYNDHMLLKVCCQNGFIELVKYLLTSPDLTIHSDIYADNCSAFKKAYNHRKMDLINYLVFDYKIEKTQAIMQFLERKFVDTSDLNKIFLTRLFEELVKEKPEPNTHTKRLKI